MVDMIRATIPPSDRGAYWVHNITNVSGQYPETGRGGHTGTEGDAIWNTLGLAAGEFEVIVVSVTASSGVTSWALEELHADGEQIVSSVTQPNLNIPMRDGFFFTTTGANNGVIITFRIQQYYKT